MRVAAGVRLGTRTPPKVFRAVSFPSAWRCVGSSLPCWWGAPASLQAVGPHPSSLWARCWGVCRISPMAFSGERCFVEIIKVSRGLFISKCPRKGKLQVQGVLNPESGNDEQGPGSSGPSVVGLSGPRMPSFPLEHDCACAYIQIHTYMSIYFCVCISTSCYKPKLFSD